jgi:hypothetical protein
MVDSISSANSVRKVGTGPARHGTPSGVSQTTTGSMAVEQIAASGDAGRRNPGDDEQHRADAPVESTGGGMTLEISEDSEGRELIYRFLDPRSGKIVGEWTADQLDKLRDYLREKNLHILDKKI